MKKLPTIATLVLVFAGFFGASVPAQALTDCLQAQTCAKIPAGATITADPSGRVSWTGVTVQQIVHFKQEDTDGSGWQTRTSVPGNSTILKDVAHQGGRFQLILSGGKWAFLDCHGQVAPTAVGDIPGVNTQGVGVICDDARGGAFGISGTRANQGE